MNVMKSNAALYKDIAHLFIAAPTDDTWAIDPALRNFSISNNALKVWMHRSIL